MGEHLYIVNVLLGPMIVHYRDVLLYLVNRKISIIELFNVYHEHSIHCCPSNIAKHHTTEIYLKSSICS